jgi:glycosyltransferase involved in cell wall biosynthesis
MRIAVYSHYFLPEIGAPSARIGDFAGQWIQQGHEVHVATCFPNHPTGIVYPGYKVSRYMHEVVSGVQVHRSWTYLTPNKGIVKKTIGHASLWLSAKLNATRRMPRPDCVIGTSPTFFAAMAARDCARRHRVPFIMEVRDLWPAIFVDLGIVRSPTLIRALELWEMSLYRSADHIVTVTDAFRSNLIDRGIESTKITAITNGADTDFWRLKDEGARSLRNVLGLEGKFVVLYIGAHGISQGLMAILRAAEHLKGQRDVVILFVGEGADKEKLLAESKRLALDNVRFLDPVGKEKVRDYYSMADLCLVPLRDIPLFDTFIPSKMFEIMAVGRPILGSVRGEAAEILRRSGAAVVVQPEDDKALAESLLQLKLDVKRRAKMGDAGRSFVALHYSRKLLGERYLEVMTCALPRRQTGVKP